MAISRNLWVSSLKAPVEVEKWPWFGLCCRKFPSHATSKARLLELSWKETRQLGHITTLAPNTYCWVSGKEGVAAECWKIWAWILKVRTQVIRMLGETAGSFSRNTREAWSRKTPTLSGEAAHENTW